MARRLRMGALVALGVTAAACGGKQSDEPVRPVSLPLPTAVIAGRQVALYPLTLVAADETLNWSEAIGTREERTARADSVLLTFLTERAPEIEWIPPSVLRAAAARAPGMLTSPDRMGTALLRADGLERVPDPLRSQMRNLTAVAGDRFVLVPAVLSFVPTASGRGSAELTLVLVDVRFGLISWRSVAAGEGDAPYDALWNALKTLVPDLP